jgi:hypothetical protein
LRGLLAAFAVLLATTVSAEEARGPRIRVDPESFDFGSVLPDRPLSKEFRLRNLGDELLVIERISKTCGCTEATARNSRLAPGATTPLLVQFTTPGTPGRVEEQVVLRSNDPETPSVVIRLSATVVAE